MIYDPINDNRICRTRYNNELYTMYDELDTARVIKIEILGWLGQCKNWIPAEGLLTYLLTYSMEQSPS